MSTHLLVLLGSRGPGTWTIWSLNGGGLVAAPSSAVTTIVGSRSSSFIWTAASARSPPPQPLPPAVNSETSGRRRRRWFRSSGRWSMSGRVVWIKRSRQGVRDRGRGRGGEFSKSSRSSPFVLVVRRSGLVEGRECPVSLDEQNTLANDDHARIILLASTTSGPSAGGGGTR